MLESEQSFVKNLMQFISGNKAWWEKNAGVEGRRSRPRDRKLKR